MDTAPSNTIGLTHIAGWTDLMAGDRLEDQLEKAAVAIEKQDIPTIVGMGGCARLVGYTSQRTGQPVTVLVVPLQGDIDSWAEDYYIFGGLSFEDATRMTDWHERYDTCNALRKQSFRDAMKASGRSR